ncbi:acyltransferase [Miniimonas sp. S16]|uniref:acyltransferase family protein n=1 Tax=Miniimonas sp. S16 TaxID=2171623 RepID=UPI00131F1897|nr:acyltransferase [Miniimonas sp. S16]
MLNPPEQVVRPRNYLGIQALRFVAAALVVVTHSTLYASDRLEPEMPVWQAGTVGVDIFFVISGFVMMITAPPFRRLSGGWRYFAMRRVTRIVPMYWIATTVKILTVLAIPGVAINNALNPEHLVASYFFLPTRNEVGVVEPVLGVGWTLTFEMFFYAVFCVALLLRVSPYIFSTVVMVLVAAGQGLGLGEDSTIVWGFYLDRVVLYFVIGMTIAKLVVSPRVRRWLVPLAVLASVVAVCLALAGRLEWFRDAPFRMAVVCALVLTVVALEDWLAPRLPRLVLFLGDASYSVYLFHPLIAPIVPAVLAYLGWRVGWLSVIGSVLAALVGCSLIYRFVERPIIRASRRLPFAGPLPGGGATRPRAAVS